MLSFRRRVPFRVRWAFLLCALGAGGRISLAVEQNGGVARNWASPNRHCCDWWAVLWAWATGGQTVEWWWVGGG